MTVTLLTVYITRPPAPLCERACAFLDQREYAYITIDVSSDQDQEAMRQRTGYSSCPLVIAGDLVIGKLEETIKADRSGRPADLLTSVDRDTAQERIMPDDNPTPDLITDHPEQTFRTVERIFVSSLFRGDMAAIRQGGRSAVESLGMYPVRFEAQLLLGASTASRARAA